VIDEAIRHRRKKHRPGALSVRLLFSAPWCRARWRAPGARESIPGLKGFKVVTVSLTRVS